MTLEVHKDETYGCDKDTRDCKLATSQAGVTDSVGEKDCCFGYKTDEYGGFDKCL